MINTKVAFFSEKEVRTVLSKLNGPVYAFRISEDFTVKEISNVIDKLLIYPNIKGIIKGIKSAEEVRIVADIME